MISTRSVGLLIDTVVCLTLAKWETVSGRFGGYLSCSRGLNCAVFWLFGNTDIDIAVSGAIGVNCVEKTDPLVCSRSNDTGPVHLRKTFDDLVLSMLLR